MTATTPQLPCYHVTTARGDVYGVAALTSRDALFYAQERLDREDTRDNVKTATRVGRWTAPLSTVFAY